MPILNTEELKKIRKSLPENGIELISKETGLKPGTIQQILYKPERFNKRVIEMAVSLGESHYREINDIINRAKKLS